MRLLPALLLSFLPAFLVAAPLPRSADYDSWHVGSSADFTPTAERPVRAGLFLSGGGGDVETAWRWFTEQAAGGDIVVLRASGADGYQDYVHSKIGGVASVTTILFKNARAAHDPAVLARIAAAEGIFMAGGDQALYIQYWKDSPVGDVLRAHLDAGKPIGGTSAGLAVLGEYFFSALNNTVTSDIALKNPFNEKVTLGTGFLRAPALAGIITDSHFMERRRLGRLIAFLARLQLEHPDAPRLLGLGVDEATALCVEPDGAARVHTARRGSVWLVQLTATAVTEPGKPLQATAAVIGLGPASTLNLRTLEVASPIALQTIRAANGRLRDVEK
jgi:cyanophycinase